MSISSTASNVATTAGSAISTALNFIYNIGKMIWDSVGGLFSYFTGTYGEPTTNNLTPQRATVTSPATLTNERARALLDKKTADTELAARDPNMLPRQPDTTGRDNAYGRS